jgi:hypothetical protein
MKIYVQAISQKLPEKISTVIPNYINITLSQQSKINLPSKLIAIVDVKCSFSSLPSHSFIHSFFHYVRKCGGC